MKLNRRYFLYSSSCACAQRAIFPFLTASMALQSTSANAAIPEMKALQVSANAYFVQGLAALGSKENQNFISNAGFVVTPKSVVVIDALGSPALAQRLVQLIKTITPLPISHVIVTHYHADHIYGLQVFKDLGAHIIAHSAAGEYLNSDTAVLRLKASREELSPWVDENTRLVVADEMLKGSSPKNLQVNGVDFYIAPAGPAHTPEDLVIYLPAEKVLFAGDLVFRGRLPFVGGADSKHWISSLNKLLQFDVAVIVPGHGAQSSAASAKADIELVRNYLVYLREQMGAAVKNLESFDEAYKATNWKAFENVPMFGFANRMNAYNTYLLMEKESL